MKSLVSTALVASAWIFVAPALAADTSADTIRDSVYDWSGVYVGAEAGYVWGNAETANTFKAVVLNDAIEPSGMFGSLHAGYNMATESNLVFGFEADIDFPMPDAGVPNAVFPADFDNAKLEWAGSARGRIGYAMDRLMPFVTGGVAIASADYSFDNNFYDSKATMLGWTVGAGLEYAATDNMILRTEFRYADYGSTTKVVDGGDQTLSLKSSDVRVGASWKF